MKEKVFSCFPRKKPENAFLTLIVNYRKIVQNKQIMPFKTTANWLFNDIVLFSHCFFYWEIGVFQETVVRSLFYP